MPDARDDTFDDWSDYVRHAAASDIGLRRTTNQDAWTVCRAENELQWRRHGHLFAVADGMGAHAAGELASRLAIETVSKAYRELRSFGPADAIRRAMVEANALIHARGLSRAEWLGMGTTCSVLLLVEQGAIVAHVGDSRVYRVRGGLIEQLTFDHSLVWELMDVGKISENEVPHAIPKNVITRSVGPNASVEVDLEGPFPVETADCYLLCSDG
ncbi:MAG: PP2C family serine/threonine-protein phosphatase, partial [Pirellulales bacterium]